MILPTNFGLFIISCSSKETTSGGGHWFSGDMKFHWWTRMSQWSYTVSSREFQSSGCTTTGMRPLHTHTSTLMNTGHRWSLPQRLLILMWLWQREDLIRWIVSLSLQLGVCYAEDSMAPQLTCLYFLMPLKARQFTNCIDGLTKSSIQVTLERTPPNWLALGVTTVKSPKIFYCFYWFLCVGTQDICINKINPNFQKRNHPEVAHWMRWRNFCIFC